MSTRTRIFRCWTLLLLLIATSVAGCTNHVPMPNFTGNGVQIKVTSVPLKIVLAAGTAALQVANDEYLGLDIDVAALLNQIVEVPQANKGMPPTDAATIMVVHKDTNDILYWRLSDKVKMIRLKHQNPGAIELKVVNDSPLRIELWIEGSPEDIEVVVEMKN